MEFLDKVFISLAPAVKLCRVKSVELGYQILLWLGCVKHRILLDKYLPLGKLRLALLRQNKRIILLLGLYDCNQLIQIKVIKWSPCVTILADMPASGIDY
jgi:hypothetical protein